jgi:hypothetical protein
VRAAALTWHGFGGDCTIVLKGLVNEYVGTCFLPAYINWILCDLITAPVIYGRPKAEISRSAPLGDRVVGEYYAGRDLEWTLDHGCRGFFVGVGGVHYFVARGGGLESPGKGRKREKVEEEEVGWPDTRIGGWMG